MPGQSLISLVGMQSTKELSATGILKTGNSSLQGNQNNHGENSFLAKLACSMDNESTIDDINSTPVPYELDNISSIEGINHLIDIASMGASTNVHDAQTPLYQVLNHNIPVETFTNSIVNNINNGNASPVQIQANTFPGYALAGNQGTSTFNEPDIYLTRIAQEIARGRHPRLISTFFTDNLNTNQISTNTNEQNAAGVINKLDPAKIAGTTGEEPLSQSFLWQLCF